MNNYCIQRVIKGAVLTMAAALLSISASSAKAQGPLPGKMSERDRNLRDREMQITLMEKGAKGSPKPEPQLLLREIMRTSRVCKLSTMK